MQLSTSYISESGIVVNANPDRSAYLSVNERGFLLYGQLYAGPLVGVRVSGDSNGNEEAKTLPAFTSTSEVRHVR